MLQKTQRACFTLLLTTFNLVRCLADEQPRAVEVIANAVATVPRDALVLAAAPFQHPLESGLVTGGLLLLIAFDKPLTRAWQQHVESSIKYRLPNPWPFKTRIQNSDVLLYSTIPVWYLSGLAFDASKAETAGVLEGKAVVYSLLISQVGLKALFARRRPLEDLTAGLPEMYKTDDPWKWGPVHRPVLGENDDRTSFPSYHFTLYLAVAKVFQEVYGNYWIPYGLAAVGLGSDIKMHHHWVSDMVAGSLLGLGIGHTIVADFKSSAQAKGKGPSVSLQPWVDPSGQAGLAARLVW